MDKIPTKKLTINPANKLTSSVLSAKSIFFASNIAAPKMTGIAAKKEREKLLYLSIPLNKSAEIVMPEREIPGIIAMLWVRPKINASLKVKFCLWPDINLFVRISIAPVAINAQATSAGELNRLSKKSLPNKPIIAVIIVTRNKSINNLKFFRKSHKSL